MSSPEPRILRVGMRYFLVRTQRDLHDVALKILNEWRTMNRYAEDPARERFVRQVCDDLDGATAWRIVGQGDVDLITPETIR